MPDSTKYMHMISGGRDHSKGQGGGGQRPFGTFPKIHPFWKGNASLREVLTNKFVLFNQG